MNPDDPAIIDTETALRLRADLDRYLQAGSLAEMRDVAAANPLLLGSYVANYMAEAAKRSRQLGDTQTAEILEFRLAILRKFREFGVAEGYWEIAIDELVRAQTTEQHRQVLLDYPDLAGEAAAAYMKRRLSQSVQIADIGAQNRYRFAITVASATIGPSSEQYADPTGAIDVFISNFIRQSDPAVQRELLASCPEILQSPLFYSAAAMFTPFIDDAQGNNRLVELRDLLVRRALFTRCQEAGVAQAFEELAKGTTWDRLMTI